MTDLDVERITEFEVEQLEKELDECRDKAEAFDIQQKLIDAMRLRIRHLKENTRKLSGLY
jgi:prefoldin subunit 5